MMAQCYKYGDDKALWFLIKTIWKKELGDMYSIAVMQTK